MHDIIYPNVNTQTHNKYALTADIVVLYQFNLTKIIQFLLSDEEKFFSVLSMF